MPETLPPFEKRLFLLRHAVALPATAAQDDFARNLAPAGVDDAHALGRYMKTCGFIPDYILCSSAVRTQQSLQHLAHDLDLPKAHYLKVFYTGAAGDYLHELQKIPDTAKNVLLIGHNPSIYELVARLCAHGRERALQKLTEGYRPASLSVIHCPRAEWGALQLDENYLYDLTDPLDYNAPARPTRWM